MQANTRTPPGTPSSPLPSRVSAGYTVIRMMPSRSIKLRRFVYRSPRLNRFHKCCSYRLAAGRIRPVYGPARLARRLAKEGVRSARPSSLHWEDGPQGRGYRGSKLRIQNAACPSVFVYVCCSTNFRICGAGIAPARRATSMPFSNNIMVGIALTRKRVARLGTSSVFTFARTN